MPAGTYVSGVDCSLLTYGTQNCHDTCAQSIVQLKCYLTIEKERNGMLRPIVGDSLITRLCTNTSSLGRLQ